MLTDEWYKIIIIVINILGLLLNYISLYRTKK